ncbi:MAG: AraC family transcriptional regulator [Leptolyngbyaceae cyanobacterium]
MTTSSPATTAKIPPTAQSECLPPIASSQTLGWKSLLVEEFQQPPGGVDQPEVYEEHILALCLAPRPHRIYQAMGDRSYTGIYTKGDISITAAGVPATYWAEGEDHYLHVQISPQLIQKVAEEAIELDPKRIELVNEFRTRDPQMEQTLLMLRSELHKGGGWMGQLYIESLANVLAVHLLREYSTAQPCVALYDGGLGDRKLLQVSDYIREYLDQDIKLEDLANLVGISQFHFSRLFKQSMGISPHQYVVQQRVERAQQLLKGSAMAIAEIALQCGFNSQSHLGKSFRKLTGTTPNAYRKNL